MYTITNTKNMYKETYFYKFLWDRFWSKIYQPNDRFEFDLNAFWNRLIKLIYVVLVNPYLNTESVL